MNRAEYAEMYRLESFYWWFVARRKLLKRILEQIARQFDHPVLLDVGCGTGLNFSVLSQFGRTFSSDASEEALKFSQGRGVERLVCSRVEALPFPSGSFDLVTSLDVLEHIDDDLKALEEMWRITKEGGWVLITTPAYGFLWSEHDEALHHRRRYTAKELRNKLEHSGFKVARISYFITSLFFPILVFRIIQNLLKKSVRPKTSHVLLPSWINSLLIGILELEGALFRWMNLPFGVSIVCLARRPKEA